MPTRRRLFIPPPRPTGANVIGALETVVQRLQAMPVVPGTVT
jgi:hypothetical protein